MIDILLMYISLEVGEGEHKHNICEYKRIEGVVCVFLKELSN
jgi:hypothetical protein